MNLKTNKLRTSFNWERYMNRYNMRLLKINYISLKNKGEIKMKMIKSLINKLNIFKRINALEESLKCVTDNERRTFDLAYDSKEELTKKIKALEDRTKQLSNRINNQLELINDNDSDIKFHLNKKIKSLRVFENDASAGHLSNKQDIRAINVKIKRLEEGLAYGKYSPLNKNKE